MAIRDARKLSSSIQYELRRRAVALRKKGQTYMEIGETLAVSHAAVAKWWGLYEKGGLKALKPGKRGRRYGACRSLTPEAERRVRRMITDKTPDQLKFSFALWTREAVRDVIEKVSGCKMPIRTVGEYLSRWGYTPQRPRKRAYQQQTKEIKKWLDETYPSIETRAKAEKAELQWGDETGISNGDQRGRGYAPRGKTPLVNINARRFSVSMISTITNRGKARFMIYSGALKSNTFVEFLRRLIRGRRQKIFLIIDNLRVHKSRTVQNWVEKNAKKIELFFLPPYAPELNPDEYLNNTVKSQLENKRAPESKRELKKNLHGCMRSNQRKTRLIKSLFQNPRVKYAS